MKHLCDKFEDYTWEYIKNTHSDSVKTKITVDIPPATEFRVHCCGRFRSRKRGC